jgi:hypothetical protein
MINIRTARRCAVVIGVGLALAATCVNDAVATPLNRERTVEWRTGIDGYTTSFVGEYFGGKGFAAEDYPSTLPTDQAVPVNGRLSPLPDGSYRSTGDFLGTYRLIEETVRTSWTVGATTIKVIEGTDQMSGCLDLNGDRKCDRNGARGTITMTFKRLATFDKSGAFIESNCNHPVTQVAGDFTSGLVFMADRATGRGDEIKSAYRGELTFRPAP